MTQFSDKEKRFKDILGELNLEIDSQEIWDAVEDRLPLSSGQEKKPIGFQKFGLFLFVLVGLTGYYGFNQLDNDSLKDQASSDSIQVFESTKAYEEAIEVVHNRKNASGSTSIKNSSIVQNIDIEDLGQVERPTNLISTSEAVIASDVVLASKPVLQKSIFSSSFNNNISNTGTSFKSDVSSLDHNSTNAPSATSQSYTTLSTTSMLDTKSSKLYTLALSPQLADNLTQISYEPRNIIHNSRVSFPQIKVVEKAAKWNKYFSLAIGHNVNSTDYRSVAILAETQGKAHFGYESGLSGISSGLMMGIENEEGYRVFGGLNYHYTANQYSNHDFDLDVTTRPGVSSVHLDGSGSSAPVLGDITETSEIQYDIDWYNENHLIDLTVGVGKVWFNQKGYSLSSDIAANYNLVAKSTGYAFNVDGDAIDKFVYGENNNLKGSKGLGLMLRANLSKSISDYIQINVSPFYNHYLNNIYSNSSFKAINSQVGLQLGITYRPGRD